MSNFLDEAAWAKYDRDGYLHLGRVIDTGELEALQARINAIMLGEAAVNYDRMLMQLDSEDGKYEHAGQQSRGHKGARLDYRKIEELEYDPLFLSLMQKPIFRAICTHVYGVETPITAFRAMFMNKPAHRGTLLPWHQDRWVYLDRDPLITIWAALDPATIPNGCVEVVPGSHQRGLINPEHPSGFVTEAQAAQHARPGESVFLELAPGEVVLLHNWLLHRSDVNTTDISRRAFSVCYMDGRTKASNGTQYSRIFGESALTPETLR